MPWWAVVLAVLIAVGGLGLAVVMGSTKASRGHGDARR